MDLRTENRQMVCCLYGWTGGGRGVAGRVSSLSPNLSLSFLLHQLWMRASDLLTLPHTTQVRHSPDWKASLSIQPSNLVPFSDRPKGSIIQ